MQTKIESAIERVADIGSGFIIAWFVYEYFILANPALRDNGFLVTCIFTAISLVRGYFWRRYFNKLTVNKYGAERMAKKKVSKKKSGREV